jgi:ubiquinone/menaquinone biosynthesis C-methylase UbiE
VNVPDTYQPSNIYVPGLSRPDARDKHPDNHNHYTDREVAMLPNLNKTHPRYPEWAGRITSCKRLIRYLATSKKAAHILEIGCGNGWLSHQLSSVPGSRVVGLDPNLNELRQAARVFRHQSNLKFIYGDFYSDVLQDLSFDVIVMAASVHHFPSPTLVIKDVLPHLRTRGELHLIDSCLYRPAIQDFSHRYLYDPRSVWNRFFRKGASLPWVCITHH